MLLGDGLTILEDKAFAGCGFREIFIPKNVKIIGQFCLCENENLEDVYLPADLEAISEDCFQDCENLSHIYVLKGCIQNIKSMLPDKADLLVEIDESVWKEIELAKSYSGYILNHQVDNQWSTHRRKLFLLDENED